MISQLVPIAMRVHPFPSRTRKLSSSASKILGGKLPGKIERCQHKYSSIAQSVEHAAVNRRVVGSSPTGGAKKSKSFWDLDFFIQADRLGISSRRSRVYHRRRRISSREACISVGLMIYKTKVLMICYSFRN